MRRTTTADLRATTQLITSANGAVRVHPEDVEASIERTFHTTGADAFRDQPHCQTLARVAICTLVLRDGYVVTGTAMGAPGQDARALALAGARNKAERRLRWIHRRGSRVDAVDTPEAA